MAALGCRRHTKSSPKSFDLEPHDSIYSRLVVTDDERLSEIAQNKDDDEIYEWFRETAQLLINENWNSFVNTEQFHKLKDGGGKSFPSTRYYPRNSQWICLGHNGLSEFSGFPDL